VYVYVYVYILSDMKEVREHWMKVYVNKYVNSVDINEIPTWFRKTPCPAKLARGKCYTMIIKKLHIYD